LRISVAASLAAPDRFEPDTPLSASKNYMDLKFAMTEALPPGVHFKLIEAVADHICETLRCLPNFSAPWIPTPVT